MTQASLPEPHHVVRYIKPSLVFEETVDGSAFLLRTNESGLSVNWLDFWPDADLLTQLDNIRHLVRLKLSKQGRFARLNVGSTKRYVMHSTAEIDIDIAIDVRSAALGPSSDFEADPSHADITGLPEPNSDYAMLIGDLIVECVLPPLFPGKLD